MAEPKKRMSLVRSKNRRRNQGLDKQAAGKCPRCGKEVVAHQTCRACLADIKE